MGSKTGIEWCDSTINPVMGCTGCELHSDDPGKNHCYAATLCRRYAGRPGWPASFTEPEHFPGRLETALRWPDLTGTARPGKPWLDGYPRLIFVNDLGDGFSPAVDPGVWLAPHIPAMAASPHVWLLLTKFPWNMRDFWAGYGDVPDNFWLGVSLTMNDGRAVTLYEIPARTRFLSIEPLLGPLRLTSPIPSEPPPPAEWIDWVIIGGESGPRARLMPSSWLAPLMWDCSQYGVPLFIKQLGRAMAMKHFGFYDPHDSKGGDWSVWPEALRVRELPEWRRT